MTKFSAAVRAGLNSAEAAKRNLQEIKEILKSLSDTVEDATEGKVRVRLRTGLDAVAEGAWEAVSSFLLAKKMFDSIVVEGTSSAKARKIEVAQFQQSTTGFPCTVSVSSDEYVCTDGESLVNVLSKIFQSTQVGMAISGLQNNAALPGSSSSLSVAVKEHSTVSREVALASPPGRIIEEPFAIKVIREVKKKPVPKKVRTATTLNKVDKASITNKAETKVKQTSSKVTGKSAGAVKKANKRPAKSVDQTGTNSNSKKASTKLTKKPAAVRM